MRPIKSPAARDLRGYAVALLVLSLVTVFAMRPAVSSCATTILGAPGDATNGGVWTAFLYDQTGGPPWLANNPFTAAPTGERWWHGYYITALFVFGPIWLFTNLTGSAVCGWNIAIASGFVLSGLSMFALARRLCRHDVAATIAAVAYTLAPYRQLKAEGHIAYVHTYAFPLLFLTGLLLWERPTKGRIAAAAAVVALLGYTDGYFILLGAVAFAALHLGAFGWTALRERAGAVEIRRSAAAVVIVAGLAVALLVPVLYTFLSTSSEISSTLTRSGQEVVNYAARPVEYLLPVRSHPVFDEVIGPWQDRNLHGSNFSESTLFLGWSSVLAAVAAVASSLRTRRRSIESVEDRWRQRAVAALALTAVAGFLFSLPPSVDVGPVTVPMPSGVVSGVVLFWRVYARFFIVVHAAVAALAAVGLSLALTRPTWSRVTRAGAAAGLVVLVLFETLVTWTPGSWSYELAPQAYRFVAAQEDVDIIAEWPLQPTSLDPDHTYLTFVPVHRKKLVNVLGDQTRPDWIARGVYGLDDPETAGVLRSLGADLVLVHRALAPGPVPADDYQLIGSFSYAGDVESNPVLRRQAARWAYLTPMHDVDVYRVRSGQEALAAIAVGRGFYGPEGAPTATSSRWMEQHGELNVVPFNPAVREATIAFDAASFQERPRRVVARQGDSIIWSGTISAPQRVQLKVAAGIPVVLKATPGPALADDSRRLSVVISGLDLISTR